MGHWDMRLLGNSTLSIRILTANHRANGAGAYCTLASTDELKSSSCSSWGCSSWGWAVQSWASSEQPWAGPAKYNDELMEDTKDPQYMY